MVCYTSTYKQRGAQLMRYQRNSKKRRVSFIVFGLIVVAGLAGTYYLLSVNNEEPSGTAPVAQSPAPDTNQPTAIEGKYLLTGTTVLARGVQQQAERADGTIDYQQPFSELHTLQPETYDAWMTELECPTTEAQMTFREQVETLVFNCPVGFIEPLVEHFELISLANNHSGDLGLDAFEETQERLDNAGAQIYGHYDSSTTDDTCEVIALPVRVQQADGSEESGRLPITFCAWHYFTRSPEPGELEAMLDYVETMPVFAFTHAGAEYFAEAQPPEIELTRSIIDLGAEFVINNNPHWVQNTEVYNDKLIVYSTGNFMFDQLDEETNRAANIDVEIRIDYDENVAQWLELGESCIGRGDNCLEQAQQRQLEKVDVSYSFDVVASLNGYRELTRKADEATQQAVERRMNWQQTLIQLGQNVSE